MDSKVGDYRELGDRRRGLVFTGAVSAVSHVIYGAQSLENGRSINRLRPNNVVSYRNEAHTHTHSTASVLVQRKRNSATDIQLSRKFCKAKSLVLWPCCQAGRRCLGTVTLRIQLQSSRQRQEGESRHGQRSQIGCVPYFYTWRGPITNLECMSEMCCTRLAGNAGPKSRQKFTIWAPSHNFIGLYIFAAKTRIDNRKKLLDSNVSPTCPHNMVNFGPLATEIVSLVWGTPEISTGLASWQRYCTVLQQWASAKLRR